ncbi:MBL fold metallo-hydrolase [Dactylosporangium matsuzakiense]|uniref:Membrane protein n=1 Tax=Dactylosporangium matsuzakiense TaxID=53360 RepID=A0A9W6KH19_9ACTN|nr:MBL fold metallo-hydrolase [Dactylosporangium matsuzakiense]UWZ47321.1 MBL fold metallo-hydrolase [Dactylosporangium matsuzakiense]GLL01373.1 membrane protein [Dactylosporangium matsuzakiense]
MDVTWWGHATVAIRERGVTILTDPVLRNRLAHLHRRRGPRPRLDRAPDAVVVSHLHGDHCDLPSLRSLPAETRLIVPHGAAAFLRRRLGERDFVELKAGQETRVRDVTIRAVPAAHDGGRTPKSRVRAAALGYVVTGDRAAWFGGDTGLFDEMKALGPVDLALVPVWGWGWTLGPGHLDPARAAEAMRLVEPGVAVPIHWGTLWPVGCGRVRPDRFERPGDEFAACSRSTAPQTDVRVLAPGESTTL